MADHDVDDLLAVARQAAGCAGTLLLDAWGQLDPEHDVQVKSSPTDVVTRLDVEAERAIRQVLAERRPGDQVLGEEQGVRGAGSAVRWVVDPLDGSVNYLYGLPTWSVSVAAEIDGTATVAVVAAPALGRTYWASRGGGAYRDGQPIQVSARDSLALALVATGFAYDAGVRSRQGTAVGRLLAQVRDIRRLGSAALDLCLLAEGAVDAYYERGIQEWDRAAGLLIAVEAGAQVELDDGMVVGAGPALFPAFRSLLRDTLA